jgi:hypothetical protein
MQHLHLGQINHLNHPNKIVITAIHGLPLVQLFVLAVERKLWLCLRLFVENVELLIYVGLGFAQAVEKNLSNPFLSKN